MVRDNEDGECSEYEVASLRQELNLRILLQNSLLVVCLGFFCLIAGVAALVPSSAWLLAAINNVAILAATLQWCHHGIRTAQIKRYLLLIETNEKGWERWLPNNRPPCLLGSLWMVSTKGVFVGFGLTVGVLAAYVSPRFMLWPAVASIVLWITSAVFLFTNPKE